MRHVQPMIVVALFGLLVGCGGAATQSKLVRGPMPEGGNFDGVYMSDFGRMELTEENGRILGLYEADQHYGRIEGEMDGDLLHFAWTQWNEDMQGKLRKSNGRGTFKYIVEIEMVKDKERQHHRLEGEWGYGEEATGNRWTANRLMNRAKKQLKPHTESAEEEEDGISAGGFETGEESTEEVELKSNEETEEKEAEPSGGDPLDGLF